MCAQPRSVSSLSSPLLKPSRLHTVASCSKEPTGPSLRLIPPTPVDLNPPTSVFNTSNMTAEQALNVQKLNLVGFSENPAQDYEIQSSRNNSIHSEGSSKTPTASTSGISQFAPISLASGSEFKTPSLWSGSVKTAKRVIRSSSERYQKSEYSIHKKASVRLLKKKKLVRNHSADDTPSEPSPISSKQKKNSFKKVLDKIKGVQKILNPELEAPKGQNDFLEHFDKISDTKFVENWLMSIDDDSAKVEIEDSEQIVDEGNCSLKDSTLGTLNRVLLLERQISNDSKRSVDTHDTGENSEITALNTVHNSNPKFTSEGDTIRNKNASGVFRPIPSENIEVSSSSSNESDYLEMHKCSENDLILNNVDPVDEHDRNVKGLTSENYYVYNHIVKISKKNANLNSKFDTAKKNNVNFVNEFDEVNEVVGQNSGTNSSNELNPLKSRDGTFCIDENLISRIGSEEGMLCEF